VPDHALQRLRRNHVQLLQSVCQELEIEEGAAYTRSGVAWFLHGQLNWFRRAVAGVDADAPDGRREDAGMNIVAPPGWLASVTVAARLVSFAVVCAVLYWGQVILMPLALAALVTFLLAPLVSALQRRGVPRILGIVVVAGGVTAALGGLGWVIGGQLASLTEELPAYRQNIRDKVADLRAATRGGALERVQSTLEVIREDLELDADTGAGPEAGSAEDAPVQVQVTPERRLLTDMEQFGPALEAVGTAGLVLLLSIFMLIKPEDLRNRLISLAGRTSLVTTTMAFQEVGALITRYLLMQFIINATMGLAVWLGLYLIGVPYSALWGVAAAVLRYIPYLGPWIAALLPITISLVTSPDWTQVALVLALFVTLELLSNNVMEPWLYGNSVGLSPFGVIISAIFWTWLWGPVGLVLATPITACLVVLGKYVPGLTILGQLLGQAPALHPHVQLYQRLLARDEDEAGDILEQHRKQYSLVETCDDLLLGVLQTLKRDLSQGVITAEEGDFVAGALQEMVDELRTSHAAEPHPEQAPVLLMGFPVRDRLDEIVMQLLQVLLREEDCDLEILSMDRLIAERIAEIKTRRPAAVCIPSLPPGDLSLTRHVCKRLRAQVPEINLIVGRLGAPDAPERSGERLRMAGAQQVVDTLEELRDALTAIVQRVRPTVCGAEQNSNASRRIVVRR
jgi:predicted PurR-regulated permease PerM